MGSALDTLEGGNGDDVYLFDRGYGNDTINEVAGTDTIRFNAGITEADVMVSRDDYNYYFNLIGSNDQLSISNWYFDLTSQIEKVEFSDGTIWSSTTLSNKTTTATQYSDFYWGTEVGNTYDGLAGNDQIYGFAGDDNLRGGAGNDFIDGGTGDDVMLGGTGNDTFVVDSIADTVTELANEGIDTIQTSVSYTLGANQENLVLLNSGYIIDGAGNSLSNTLRAMFMAMSLRDLLATIH